MSPTPVVHFELRISPRILEKNRKGPNGIIRGLGETDPCRKPGFEYLVALSLSKVFRPHRALWTLAGFEKNLGPTPAHELPCFFQDFWVNLSAKELMSNDLQNFPLCLRPFSMLPRGTEWLTLVTGNGSIYFPFSSDEILNTSGSWPRVRARALHAPVFLGSLLLQTGRCAPSTPIAASLLLIRPPKILTIYRTLAAHGKGFFLSLPPPRPSQLRWSFWQYFWGQAILLFSKVFGYFLFVILFFSSLLFNFSYSSLLILLFLFFS